MRSMPPKLRAPQEDGEILLYPAADDVPLLTDEADQILTSASQVSLQGRTLAQLRDWARQAALSSAKTYTEDITGGAVACSADGPWFLTGHQPALFHPGVWAKNFAASGLAARANGLALNLIVDNDLCTRTGLPVPRGPAAHPRIETVPFLSPQPARPWEESIIDNARPFETFGQTVAEIVKGDWGFSPLVESCWDDAVAMRECSPLISDCLTAMRCRQERRLNMSNLELPLSRLEETDPFRWFTAHLIAKAEQFREVHNSVLREYRKQYRIRSRSHPVPELDIQGDWIETPFWIWKKGATQRGRLFARSVGPLIELAKNGETVGTLRLKTDADACCAVEDLQQMSGAGWRIRSRALTTTLFARLCLADLFLHGIGGAKYDELTDQIMERFFQMTAPPFLTVTATKHLPLGGFDASMKDLRELERQLRAFQSSPERFLDDPAAAPLIREKQRLIEEQRSSREAGLSRKQRRARRPVNRERHHKIMEITRQLRSYTAMHQQQTRKAYDQLSAQLQANRILRSREYAWCLFPRNSIQELFDSLQAMLR